MDAATVESGSALFDLSGIWKGQVHWKTMRKEEDSEKDKAKEYATPTLKLRQEGNKLTGIYEGSMGIYSVTGHVDGDEVELELEMKTPTKPTIQESPAPVPAGPIGGSIPGGMKKPVGGRSGGPPNAPFKVGSPGGVKNSVNPDSQRIATMGSMRVSALIDRTGRKMYGNLETKFMYGAFRGTLNEKQPEDVTQG